MAILDLNPGLAEYDYTAGAQRVYFRTNWADDWTLVDYVHCSEVVWSTSPTMPTASLIWDYGSIKRDDKFSLETVAKFAQAQRAFVKIEFDTEGGTVREWCGTYEIDEDTHEGAFERDGNDIASGRSVLTCYGFDKMLSDFVVDTTVYKDQNDGEIKTAGYAHAFNSRGKPNRTAQREGPNDVYIFEPCEENAEFWSSRDIAEYLLAYHTPKDNLDNVVIPFVPVNNVLPDWDKPEIRPHGRTTYELLNKVADARRLFIWYLSCNTDDEIEWFCDTMVAAEVEIDLPGAENIPANTQLTDIYASHDTLTSVGVNESSLEVYDQIVMRGRRRRSVGTFSVFDATLEAGWTPAEQNTYEQGATGTAAHTAAVAAGDVKLQQKLHAEARNRPELKKVFSYFEVPKTWTGKVKDGEGGAENDFFDSPKFYGEQFIEPSLPLIEGVDYSGQLIQNLNADESAIGERVNLAPLVVILRPVDGRWVSAELVGQDTNLETTDDSENNRFSLAVEVPNNSHGFYLKVGGQPQHVLAGTSFTALGVDENLGAHTATSSGMLATLAIEADAFAEGVWPDPLAGGFDVVKRKIIDAGDGYRRDDVAPGTVVGVDSNGALIRSDGGVLPAVSPSDERRLAALAKLAFSWYGIPHAKLSLQTARLQPDSALPLACVIVTYGDPAKAGEHNQVVNAPVTQVRITAPFGRPEDMPLPTMSIQTWAGELDALQLDPPNDEENQDEERTPLPEFFEDGSFEPLPPIEL